MAVLKPAGRENQRLEPPQAGQATSWIRSPDTPILPTTLPQAGRMADRVDQSWRAESDADDLRHKEFFVIPPWQTWPSCSKHRQESGDSSWPGELGPLPWPQLDSGHPVPALLPP